MTDNLINGGATSLMLWELQKITKNYLKLKKNIHLTFE